MGVLDMRVQYKEALILLLELKRSQYVKLAGTYICEQSDVPRDPRKILLGMILTNQHGRATMVTLIMGSIHVKTRHNLLLVSLLVIQVTTVDSPLRVLLKILQQQVMKSGLV